MIRNVYKGLMLLFAALVLYSLLIFDRNKEEIGWRQSRAQELGGIGYTSFDDWTAYNISKSQTWESTSDDPILISPVLETVGARQTYIHAELKTEGGQIQVFWRAKGTEFSEANSRLFDSGSIEWMVDGDAEQIRIDPADRPDAAFTVKSVQIKKYK